MLFKTTNNKCVPVEKKAACVLIQMQLFSSNFIQSSVTFCFKNEYHHFRCNYAPLYFTVGISRITVLTQLLTQLALSETGTDPKLTNCVSIDALLNGLIQIVLFFERLVMQIHNCSRAVGGSNRIKNEYASTNRKLLPNRCLYPLYPLEYMLQIVEYNVSYMLRLKGLFKITLCKGYVYYNNLTSSWYLYIFKRFWCFARKYTGNYAFDNVDKAVNKNWCFHGAIDLWCVFTKKNYNPYITAIEERLVSEIKFIQQIRCITYTIFLTWMRHFPCNTRI